MGKASISIAITSNYNSRGIDRARADMERLAVQAVSMHGSIGKAAVDAGAYLGQLGARMESVGKQIASVGDKLTMGITLPVGLAATATTIAATQIDTAWYNVRKTVDMTEQGYQELKRSAIELADTQPVSAETILNIESLGGQLGISTGYLEEFARVVSGLDIATNLDADTAATDLAQFRNIVRMSEDDLDNWASTVVDLGNHTATTEADMVNLAMRFASAGHIAGMSNAEILGLSAALSGLGMRAEAGGSAISRTINDINTSVSVGGEKLEKWADLVKKTPEEFAAAWRSDPTREFLEVLQHIGDAGEDMGKVLDDLGITQIRQSDAMRRLASSGEYVNEVVERANAAWQQNSALTQEVENRNESLAAKFETVWNRITNTAAIIGDPVADAILHAMDAMEPLFESIRDGAEAFAELNPETQDFIFKLAGIAAAAGPTLSIMGRLTQLGGSYFKTVGRISQQIGVYTEALKTQDVAMLRTLSSNDSFAARLGISRNSLVRAAGGADLFKAKLTYASEATRDMAERTRRAQIYEEAYAQAQAAGVEDTTRLNNIARRATKTRSAQASVTKAGEEAVKRMSVAEVENAHLTKEDEEAVKSQSGALAAGTVQVNAMRTALLGLGAIGGIVLLTAGITYLANEAEHARERAERLEKATNGLDQACRASAISADSQARAEDDLASSHSNLAAEAERVIERQGQLAEEIDETNRSANEEIGELNRAWETIEQYANKSNLGSVEQFKLKEAIETVNELGGTQYEVIDAVNGKIADENGAIQENTDKLKENIDAIKRHIQMSAIQSNLEGLYSQQAENNRAMADLYAENADVIEQDRETRRKMDEIIAQSNEAAESGDWARVRELNTQYGELNGKLHESAESYFDVERSQGQVTKSIADQERALQLLGESVDSVADSFGVYLETSGRAQYFTALGKDVDLFTAACQGAGISVEDLAKMSDSTFQGLVSGFTGTADSIIEQLSRTAEGREILGATLQEMGSYFAKFRADADMALAFGDKIDEASGKFHDLGISMEAVGSISEESARRIAESYDGTSQSIVDALEGMDETRWIAKNIGDDWYNSFSESTRGVIDSVANMRGYTYADLRAMAEDFGFAGDEAVAEFMRALAKAGDDETPEQVAKTVAESMREPGEFSRSGADNGDAFNAGLASKTGEAENTGKAVSNAAAGGESSSGTAHEASGASNANSYTGGVQGYTPTAYTVGAALSGSAANGELLSGSKHRDAGTGNGNQYASGLDGTSDAAGKAGWNVSGAAIAALQSGAEDAYSWGAHLGQNFADGMRSSNGFVTNAATALAFSAAHLLRHSTPEAGPLKDDDEWGYHMARNIADGMTRGVPLVSRQGLALANAMAAARQGGYGSMGMAASSMAVRRYGQNPNRWQGYGARADSPTPSTPATLSSSPLTKEDVRDAVASALSEATPPEIAVYASSSKIASSTARSMDYELGKLRSRW